jgi:hypothetical protein
VYIEHHTIQNTFSSFIIIRFGGWLCTANRLKFDSM